MATIRLETEHERKVRLEMDAYMRRWYWGTAPMACAGIVVLLWGSTTAATDTLTSWLAWIASWWG